ncbi:hypothetical protein H2200_006725 [Cladophialophora chaetospira]|uniref:DUF3669 domain-containing protein n=1 Tax=Cladophialophora chaetospira TaxID=386627 RepID=A0AA39CI51_9EURO|nr:hypothetical protein H2200_006725 [Cladophialophora chaetospira]
MSQPEAGPQYRDIGRGTCGSVFAIPLSVPALAIKKGSDTAAIRNDFTLTTIAHDSCLKWTELLRRRVSKFNDKIPPVPKIPWVKSFHAPEDDTFWTEEMKMNFPEGDRDRGAVFHIQHILPVREEFRRRLVRTFFVNKPNIHHHVLSIAENQDCLVRLYLGANNPAATRRYDRNISLRNFPVYLDDAWKRLGLDVQEYAGGMARGLAVLHWEAGIDGQDVEVVLGCEDMSTKGEAEGLVDERGTQERTGRKAASDEAEQREMQMWMLDFDKASQFPDLASQATTAPDEIVRKYVVAVTGNDPYFPHPHLDGELWKGFREMYLEVSETIIATRQVGPHVGGLPGKFIREWERWAERDVLEEDPFERDDGDDGLEDGDADGWEDEAGEDADESGSDIER